MLSISSTQALDLDDRELTKIGKAWPHLLILQLFSPPDFFWAPTIRITHVGVARLLECCPFLYCLRIPFIVDGVIEKRSEEKSELEEQTKKEEWRRIHNWLLRKLNVGPSPCHTNVDIVNLARFICNVAPKLTVLKATHDAELSTPRATVAAILEVEFSSWTSDGIGFYLRCVYAESSRFDRPAPALVAH